MLRYRILKTRWGCCAFLAGDAGLRRTYLPEGDDDRMFRRLLADAGDAREDTRLLPDFAAAVRRYFEGKPVRFDVALDHTGLPEFRRRVYEACRKVPFGTIASYADLARAAGNERATRAAGSAMAHNSMPLVIPCHRIVRSDGTIGGFSSQEGVSMKRKLLAHEGVELGSHLKQAS